VNAAPGALSFGDRYFSFSPQMADTDLSVSESESETES